MTVPEHQRAIPFPIWQSTRSPGPKRSFFISSRPMYGIAVSASSSSGGGSRRSSGAGNERREARGAQWLPLLPSPPLAICFADAAKCGGGAKSEEGRRAKR
jgi:hypothetical protein